MEDVTAQPMDQKDMQTEERRSATNQRRPLEVSEQHREGARGRRMQPKKRQKQDSARQSPEDQESRGRRGSQALKVRPSTQRRPLKDREPPERPEIQALRAKVGAEAAGGALGAHRSEAMARETATGP